MKIAAIDPGTEMSALVIYDCSENRLLACEAAIRNVELVRTLSDPGGWDAVVIEMVAGYGMPVGAEVFETCVWIGRFIQASSCPVHRMLRREVKLSLCGICNAKDANVRQALLDHFGPGRASAVGTRGTPGPLYGVCGDGWSALAVAVAWTQREQEKTARGGPRGL
mgnify:CR=1 FL=1